MAYKLALQLYTLRESCDEDFLGTLDGVAKLGFEGVEFAGFYDVKAEDLSLKLKEIGLEAIASHTPIDQLKDHLEEVIKYNQTISNKRIVCPYSEWQDEASFQEIISTLIEAGRRLNEVGMTLYYHNHQHEFEVSGDGYYLDRLFKSTIPASVQMELDACWCEMAGVSAVDYMDKNKDICGLIHVKDALLVDNKAKPVALGDGVVDIKAILEQVEALELPWIILENDFPEPDGFTNVKKSLQYLETL